MTSDLRTHRRNIPATTLETWIPILFGWFPLAFVVFIFVAIVFLFQGYQKKGQTILGSTLLGGALMVAIVVIYKTLS